VFLKICVPAISMLLLSSAPVIATAHPPFHLSSTAFVDGDTLPVQYTCEGEGIIPPLNWTGIPSGTQSLVLIMDHKPSPRPATLDAPKPPAAEGQVDTTPPKKPKPSTALRWYWTVYNIAPDVTAINSAKVTGTIGSNVVNEHNSYAPPCSKGPGVKHYDFHLYALSTVLDMSQEDIVSEGTLRRRMDGLILDTDTLTVSFERSCRLAPKLISSESSVAAQPPVQLRPQQADEQLVPRNPPPDLPLCATAVTTATVQ